MFLTSKPLYFSRAMLMLAFSFVISACTSLEQPRPQIDVAGLLNDPTFPSADQYHIESPESLFELSEEAKAFVSSTIRPGKPQEQQVFDLMDRIFDRSDYDLLYRADANTNASDTFENRAANCLSLTIMTYAMSRYAGFNARFQQVNIPEFWTRRSGYTLVNGHINLRVIKWNRESSVTLLKKDIIIDFDPQDGLRNFSVNDLTKETIVAMYYNNKAAELVLDGELNHAYAYLKAALKTDPNFKGALLNLGLVYRQAGKLELAERAYLSAIALDMDYLTAWENLATLHQRLGKTQEAEAIYARIEKQRVTNPYYHMMLAEEALDASNYGESIAHFKRAISIDDSPHQFYFGLAKAYFELDEFDNTKRYLTLAKRKARGQRIASDYGDKMSMLAKIDKLN